MKKTKILKRCIISIIFFIAMIVFIMLLRRILKNDIENFDKAIYGFVSKFQTDWVTYLAKFFTYLGGEIGTCIIGLFTFIFVLKKYKDKRTAMMIILNLVVVLIMNQALKYIIRRDRPQGYRLVNANGYSFPSGHSMIAMAHYGFMIYLIWDITNKKHIPAVKVLMTLIFAVTIALIGLSRIYLGVHYASDVCAGLSLSFAYLILFVNLYEKVENDLKDEEQMKKEEIKK